MKFALLINDDETFHSYSDAQKGEVVMAHKAYVEALGKAGVIVGGEPLAPSGDAVTIRPDGTVQDGPFADSKEQLGGFYLIDVKSKDEAIEWARRLPQCAPNGGGVEVRPVPDYSE